ncbi:hypothetical protein [Paraburkholderia dinghuensis]|uniref:Uncharacterized protein n=1 Tax=Paraburkholderia dinghuensis TaxID=2305225 RepID=A0A3N6NFV9_9BURK|nr:hypothetical protein [Paraburkholderia dinghuensis]RQH07537.1 hypothetical protein D1Y85_09185 [Paraburkholderia dinghuensis]
MNKVSLAILISLSALTGAVHAQTEGGVIMSTDPQKVAQFEQHAQEVQAQQQQAAQAPAMPMKDHTKHHHQKKAAE